MTEEFNREISEALANKDMESVSRLLRQITKQDINEDIEIRAMDQDSDGLVSIHHISPLHLAVEHGLLEVAECLIEQEADVSSLIKGGEFRNQTALRAAVDNNDLPMAKLLLEKGADPNIRDIDRDQTDLIFAIYLTRMPELIALLLEHNADPNIAPTEGSNKGETALCLAAKNNNFEAVKLLVSKGASINAAASKGIYKGRTPLASAANNDNLDMVKFLVENRADPNIADAKGVTPLIWATSRGNENLVRFLILNNAKVGDLDSENWKLALGNAKLRHADICVKLVENAKKAQSGEPLLYVDKAKYKRGSLNMLPMELRQKVSEMLTGHKTIKPPQKPT